MSAYAVELLLFDLALILMLARLLGGLARRLGQPPVIGEILAGILLGPTLFGGAITRQLFPLELKAPLTAIARTLPSWISWLAELISENRNWT